MAHHRQRAAQMNRNELAQLADELIQRAHLQEHMIMELQRAAANLLLAQEMGPARVTSEHEQWARELMEGRS